VKDFYHSVPFIWLVLFPLRIVILGAIERRFAAYPFNARAVLAMDLFTTIFYAGVTFQLATLLSQRIGYEPPVPQTIDELPVAARVALYLVVADFGHYWVHRLAHTPLLWRIHRWHHSPTHISWAAGNRDTLLDSILVNLAYIFAWPLLGTVSHRVEVFLLLIVMIKNDWMHLNVGWRLSVLEGWLITPRDHHLHHSSDPAHLNRNFGVLLSVWDRLFGTFLDPDRAPARLKFGNGEQVSRLRLVSGL